MKEQLKEFLDNVAIFTHNNYSDASTMVSILRHINGGECPDNLINGDLIRPTILADFLDVVNKTCESGEYPHLSDDELDSLIDGEIYEYIASKYVEVFYNTNIKLIKKYVDSWESTKTLLDISSDGF